MGLLFEHVGGFFEMLLALVLLLLRLQLRLPLWLLVLQELLAWELHHFLLDYLTVVLDEEIKPLSRDEISQHCVSLSAC